MKNLLLFSALRIATFLALWWVLGIFMDFYLSGISAAIIAFFISIIFFGKPRDKAVEPLQEFSQRRHENKVEKVDKDAEAEDAVADDYLMNYGQEK